MDVSAPRNSRTPAGGSEARPGPAVPFAGRAAQALRAALPEVLAAYQTKLIRVDSLLATRPDAWQTCRRQALTVLNECVAGLEQGTSLETDEAADYTRLLGAHRALQQIPIAESVRASELLWSALQPALQGAAECEKPSQRTAVWRRVNAVFRRSVSIRLYSGSLGYEEARNRTMPSYDTAKVGAPPPRPTQAEDDAPQEELTARERQILDAVACAYTNRQIARHLGITESTVKRHLHNIFRKLGATSRLDAIQKGQRAPSPPSDSAEL